MILELFIFAIAILFVVIIWIIFFHKENKPVEYYGYQLMRDLQQQESSNLLKRKKAYWHWNNK
jgi:hypothetical protein